MARPPMPVRETVLLFGPDKSLVGVITDPAPAALVDGRPAVVLLNAGLLHRVGPNRLYVRLARRLAERGLLVARFDLSGIGDSRAAGGRSDFAARAIAETRACLDLLATTRGASCFVVCGLCSGADQALLAAGEDPRIVGLALLEPGSAPSTGQLIDSYRDRLLRPASWARLLTGRSEAWSTVGQRLRSRWRRWRRHTVETAGAASAGTDPHSPAERMRRFVGRGGALCLVYSAGNPAHYYYRTALAPRLWQVPADRLLVEVVEETDHVFTPLDAQRQVIDSLCAWAEGLRR
ncbi:MAG TPA: alpha/beta hydrolase [Vicinamibacteria bacterium]|nr:alpha/beta hydrolase [Vicinamibacteria bacterium]